MVERAALMQKFTIKNGQVYGYEPDQIDLYKHRISNEGHESFEMPPPTPPLLADLAAAVQRKVGAEYTRRMNELASGYPAHERESWPVQLAEAQAIQANETTITPWIDQCAAKRGLARTELAERILQKDAVYRQVSGGLTGIRQWHEDRIDTLLHAGEVSRQALETYDSTQGWPSADLREPQTT